MRILDRVCAELEGMAAGYALIGARALGIRGYPRMTVDYDLLTVDRRVLDRSVWRELERAGFLVDVRPGDFDDPLGGVVRVRSHDGGEVDVVVGKREWQRGVVGRAERLDLGGVVVPVALRGDLVLLKLDAGGVLDLQDVIALTELGDRDETIRHVEEHLRELGDDSQRAWKRLRAEGRERG
jgi:hypothetical protein